MKEIPISAEQSTVELKGSANAKVGEATSVMVTLLSDDGLPVSGQSVEISVSPAEKVIIVQPSLKTNNKGQAVGTFTVGK